MRVLGAGAHPLAASCMHPTPLSCRKRSSNPSGKCSYERPTRGTVWGTMRSVCGADAGCLAIHYQILVLPRLMQQTILMDEECVLVVWLIIGQWITKLSARGAAASNPSRFFGSEFGSSARPSTPPPSPSAPAPPWCAGGPCSWLAGGCPTWLRVWGLRFRV